MRPKPYTDDTIPEATKTLNRRGLLSVYPPYQVEREDLRAYQGIDIHYRFRNMTPAKLRDNQDLILSAARDECDRYPEFPHKFVTMSVDLQMRGQSEPTPRTYTAARHSSSNVLVYGEGALGYRIPETHPRGFLTDKIQDILRIPETPSPKTRGALLHRQRPFVVREMIIAVRTRPGDPPLP